MSKTDSTFKFTKMYLTHTVRTSLSLNESKTAYHKQTDVDFYSGSDIQSLPKSIKPASFIFLSSRDSEVL